MLGRDVGPLGAVLRVEFEPLLKTIFGIGQDRFSRALGLANAAVDTFVRVDYEHVLAFVEAIYGANLDAVHIFAFDAGIGDDVGHCSVSPLGSSVC